MFEKLKNSLTGFVEKVSTKTLSEDQIEDVLWELQLILLENDVALSVAAEIGELLKKQLTGNFSQTYPSLPKKGIFCSSCSLGHLPCRKYRTNRNTC